MTDEDESEIELRIVLLGDSLTNKTRFLLKYVGNEESKKEFVTIGLDIKQRCIYMKETKIN